MDSEKMNNVKYTFEGIEPTTNENKYVFEGIEAQPKEEKYVFEGIESTQQSYGLREDNTPKGQGYLGPIQTSTGEVMTEKSISVNFNGKEQLIPTLVPTLTQEEIQYLGNGGVPTKEIVDKAVKHAIQRQKEGKSVWADEYKPEESNTFQKITTNIIPSFIGITPGSPPAELAQSREGLEILKETSKNAFRDLAVMGAVEVAFAPLSILLPASPLVRAGLSVSKAATTGAAIPTVESLTKEGKLPSAKEIAKEGAKWAAIDAGLQLLFHASGRFFPKNENIKVPKINPIQRKVEAAQRIIDNPAATAGEKEAAQRAIDRLSGKYDVATGISKIADANNTSTQNIFNRIWNKVSEWKQKVFGKPLTPKNVSPEDVQKFIEYVEQEEKSLPVSVETSKVVPENIMPIEVTTEPTPQPNIKTVYHGSPETDIKTLKRYMKDHADSGGIFFTENPDEAKSYAGINGKVYETKLDVSQFFDVNNPEHINKLSKYVSKESLDAIVKAGSKNGIDWPDASMYSDEIQEAGFNGAKVAEPNNKTSWVSYKEEYPVSEYKEQETPSKPLKSAPTQPTSQPTPQPTTSTEVPPKKSEMIEILRKAFEDPIRVGKFRQKALGIHKPWEKVTRLLKANDVVTALHEIGHNLQFYMYGDRNAKNDREYRRSVINSLRPFRNELKQYHTHANLYLEGHANFVREYVIDRNAAKQKAPNLFAEFETRLNAMNPDMLKALDLVSEMYREYTSANPVGRVKAQVAESEQSLFDKLKEVDYGEKSTEFVTNFIDDLFPLKEMVAELFGVSTADVENIKDPLNVYTAARVLRGNIGKAEVFLTKETFDFSTLKKNGESLYDIIKSLSESEISDLDAFLIARRAIEKNAQGIETGITTADATSVYNDLKSKYEPYAIRIDGFQDRLLNYYKDSGLLSHESYKIIKQANKFYVPFYRDVGKKRVSRLNRKLQANPVLKRMKGSGLDIISPLESIMVNTYKMIEMADKNRVGKILTQLAETKKGSGSFVEQIPTPINLVAKVSPKEILTAVKKGFQKFYQYITTDKDPTNIERFLPPSLNIFRPETFNAGKDTITVWFDGKPKFYQVSPSIYQVFTQSFNRPTLGMFTNILKLPSRILRAGAILNPRFIQKNIVRDTWGTLVFTKYKTNLFDVLQGLMHAIKKDNLYIEWLKSGGGFSTMQSLDRGKAIEHIQRIGKPPKFYDIVGWLRYVAEISEEANRLAEFSKALQIEGSTREGQERAALASRDISIDYAKFGLMTQAFNAITSFFHAHIQGLEKFYRSLKSSEDRPEAIARLLRWVVFPTLLVWMINYLNKDEDIDELSEQEKDQNLIFKANGQIVKIPITIEPGILVHALTRRLLDFTIKQDPKAFDGYMGSILNMSIPPAIPNFAGAPLEHWANKDFFTNARLTPRYLEGLLPELQYKDSTSLTARLVSRGIAYMSPYDAWSPIIIDNYIRSWGAGLGTQTVKILDWSLEKAGLGDQIEKPEEGTLKRLGLDAFIIEFPRAYTKSIEQFYDTYDKNKVLINSLKHTIDIKDEDAYKRIVNLAPISKLDAAYQAMQQSQKAINEIYKNPEIDAHEKRLMINELYNQQIKFCRAFNKEYESEFKKLEKEKKSSKFVYQGIEK